MAKKIKQRVVIPVAPGDRGVVIFHTWRNKIPVGVQVGRTGGGGKATQSVSASAPEEALESKTFKDVRLSSYSFLEQCSLTVVNVLEDHRGHCRVYLNWEVNSRHPGWNEWGKEGNSCRTLLTDLFRGTHKSVKVRLEEKKTSLVFSSEPARGPVETIIEFKKADV